MATFPGGDNRKRKRSHSIPAIVNFIVNEYENVNPDVIVQAIENGEEFISYLVSPTNSQLCNLLSGLERERIGGGTYGSVHKFGGFGDYVVKKFGSISETTGEFVSNAEFHLFKHELNDVELSNLDGASFNEIWTYVSSILESYCERHPRKLDCNVLMFAKNLPSEIVGAYNGYRLGDEFHIHNKTIQLHIPLFALPCKRDAESLDKLFRFSSHNYKHDVKFSPFILDEYVVITKNDVSEQLTDFNNNWMVHTDLVYICQQDFLIEAVFGILTKNMPHIVNVLSYQICAYNTYEPKALELTIMEKMDGTAEQFLITLLRNPYISIEDKDNTVLALIIDVLLGLIELQDAGINHNDLKINNILYSNLSQSISVDNDECNIHFRKSTFFKITDFGLSAKYPLSDDDFFMTSVSIFNGFGKSHPLPNYFSRSYDVLFFFYSIYYSMKYDANDIRLPKVRQLLKESLDNSYTDNFIRDRLRVDPEKKFRDVADNENLSYGTMIHAITATKKFPDGRIEPTGRPLQEVFGACEVSADPRNLLQSNVFDNFRGR